MMLLIAEHQRGLDAIECYERDVQVPLRVLFGRKLEGPAPELMEAKICAAAPSRDCSRRAPIMEGTFSCCVLLTKALEERVRPLRRPPGEMTG